MLTEIHFCHQCKISWPVTDKEEITKHGDHPISDFPHEVLSRALEEYVHKYPEQFQPLTDSLEYRGMGL